MLMNSNEYLNMLTLRTEVSVFGRVRASSPFGFLTYCLLTDMVRF